MITKKFEMTFLPYDYEGIEKELSEKSSQGWQLVKTGEYYWTFTQGECNEFQYNVTYLPNASEYHSEDTDHQITLDEYCTNAGWERVCNYKKIQIYRNRDPLAVPIDTDEAQKLQMIHKAIKRWMLFPTEMFTLFLAVLLISVCRIFFKRNDPMTFGMVRILVFLIVTIVEEIVRIGNYYFWYVRSKKKIAVNGKCCSTERADKIEKIGTVAYCVFVVWDVLFFQIKTMQGFSDMLLILGGVIFYQIHAVWIRKLCRYIGCPAIVNRIVTIVCSFILSVFCSLWIYIMLIARGFLPMF